MTQAKVKIRNNFDYGAEIILTIQNSTFTRSQNYFWTIMKIAYLYDIISDIIIFDGRKIFYVHKTKQRQSNKKTFSNPSFNLNKVFDHLCSNIKRGLGKSLRLFLQKSQFSCKIFSLKNGEDLYPLNKRRNPSPKVTVLQNRPPAQWLHRDTGIMLDHN